MQLKLYGNASEGSQIEKLVCNTLDSSLFEFCGAKNNENSIRNILEKKLLDLAKRSTHDYFYR